MSSRIGTKIGGTLCDTSFACGRPRGNLERPRPSNFSYPLRYMFRQDLELTNKCKELGQQAGIIEYINKLSSNAAEAVVAAKAVVTVGHGDRVTSVPADSEGHSQKC